MNEASQEKSKMDTAFVDKDTLIAFPDVKVMPHPSYTYIPTCGSKYTMVACDENGDAVGWVTTESLGYHNVRKWMDAQ